jgi:archaellum component FlaC
MSDLDPAAAALDAAAEDAGVSREELLKRALVALAESEGIDVPDADEVAAIEARLDDLDAELDEKVTDLRERFIELYREVESLDAAEGGAEDGEAAQTAASEGDAAGATATRVDELADELEEIAARLDRLDAAVADAPTADRVDDIGERLDALDARIDELDAVRDRLDAFGDRLGGVDERVDEIDGRVGGVDDRLDDVESDLAGISADDLTEIDDKLSRVANAVVRVKRRLDAAERDRADRERVDALTRTANRHGVRTADCDHCGGGVELGLLSAPECPHCGRRFEDLEPNTGFLGTSKLLVGDAPAIDGEVADGAGRDEMSRTTDRTSTAASDGGPDGDRR